MANETIVSNATIVLEDEVLHGSALLRDGLIADISKGVSARGEDFEGDFLIPGLVELHTDHLEAHYAPRPGVRWNVTSAIQSHDAQVAASGITTVYDCLRLGSDEADGFVKGEMRAIADALVHAAGENRLRAEHRIHLRCEVSAADVMDHFDDFRTVPLVGLASLMDHAPGQRQFQTMDQYTLYYKEKRGLSDEAFAHFVKRRQDASATFSARHRREISQACRDRGVALASHDDATLAHVDDAREAGVKVAEFPTSLEAAKASHEAGMGVLMGAPNVVRGMSHSGNISARDLAAAGVLDILSSDYVPFSLVHAPFVLVEDGKSAMSLPQAIALVTANPARQVGLDDRGRIAPGLRADLVRVRRTHGVPVVRSVWRGGRRVA